MKRVLVEGEEEKREVGRFREDPGASDETAKRCSATNRPRPEHRERERRSKGDEVYDISRGHFFSVLSVLPVEKKAREKRRISKLLHRRKRGRRVEDKKVKQKADYVTRGMKYGVGTGAECRARHNRVIFTRDLGGDFAREGACRRASSTSLFLSFFVSLLSFDKASLLRLNVRVFPRSVGFSQPSGPRAVRYGRQSYFNVPTRLLFPTSLLFRSGKTSLQDK